MKFSNLIEAKNRQRHTAEICRKKGVASLPKSPRNVLLMPAQLPPKQPKKDEQNGKGAKNRT